MTAAADPNKAKTARRVIEVLEYFDEQHPRATVMDIVRRYDRPQSSTSELLASLVDMGLLYKDADTRSYSPTPRAAILGSLSQPAIVRDGRLSALVDRLSAQTGLGLALFGTVGLNAQIFRWKPGTRAVTAATSASLANGAQEPLCASAAGWLLLSTLQPGRREAVIRRLNAEAADPCKFSHADMAQRVALCAQSGASIGPAGFGATADVAAILLPDMGDRPLAIGFVYEPSSHIVPEALIAELRRAVQRCAGDRNHDSVVDLPISSAA